MDLSTLQFIQISKHQLPLVNQFYKQVYKKGRANKSEQIFVLKKTKIYSAARIKKVQEASLLTGVACMPEWRGQGVASLLIRSLLRQQAAPLYCFPYPHLQNFYLKLGFCLYDAEQLPTGLREKYQRYNNRKALLCMIYTSNNINKSA